MNLAGFEWTITAMVAAFLTLFDLDRTFYLPSESKRKWQLYGWWWGFVVANGALAALFYAGLSDIDYLKNLEPWLRALVLGLAYTAILRTKFTTIPIGAAKFLLE